jgi:hypothetical protein
MTVHGHDRGALTVALIAPILAAVIGGAAAIGAAVSIVQSAPPNSGTAVQLSSTDVQYGNH